MFIVGFSNSVSTIIKLNLSSIDQPGNRIGETAVKYLIDEINNESKSIIKQLEIKTKSYNQEIFFNPLKNYLTL
jgi:LacI family transcriptional regulator